MQFSFYNHFEIIHISFQLKCIIYSCMKTYFFTQITFQFFFILRHSIPEMQEFSLFFFLFIIRLRFIFFLKFQKCCTEWKLWWSVMNEWCFCADLYKMLVILCRVLVIFMLAVWYALSKQFNFVFIFNIFELIISCLIYI